MYCFRYAFSTTQFVANVQASLAGQGVTDLSQALGLQTGRINADAQAQAKADAGSSNLISSLVTTAIALI